MVAFADTCESEAPSRPSSFGSVVVVAVEDDGADAGGHFSASRVGSDDQGKATFTGYIADNETGLLHARARQYSPTLGRFVSRDPIGYVSGTSLYRAYFVPGRLDPNGTIERDDSDYDENGNPIVPPTWSMEDFWRRYLSRDGAEVRLSETGLVNRWRNLVQDQLNSNIGTEMRSRIPGPVCSDYPQNYSGSISFPVFTPHGLARLGSLDMHSSMLDPMYAIGNSQITCEYKCSMKTTCVPCCDPPSPWITFKPESASISCQLDCHMRDHFEDPFDLGVNVGRSYEINYDFFQSWNGTKTYKGCKK